MRRAPLDLAVVLAVGAALGAGVLFTVNARARDPNPHGGAVVCDRDAFVSWSRPNARCWQSGHRVTPPPAGGQCGPYPETRWDQLAPSVSAIYVYACFGTE